jgi:hypothetical protein
VAIAYSGRPRNELIVFDLAMRTQVVIKHPDADALLRDPSFSSDGEQLVLVAGIGFDKEAGDIFIVDLHDASSRRIVGQDGRDRRFPRFKGEDGVAFWEELRDPNRVSIAIGYVVVSLDLSSGGRREQVEAAYAFPGNLTINAPRLYFTASLPLERTVATGGLALPDHRHPFSRASYACDLDNARQCSDVRTLGLGDLPHDDLRLLSTNGDTFIFYGPAAPGSPAMMLVQIDRQGDRRFTPAPAFGSLAAYFTLDDICVAGQLAHGLSAPAGVQRLCLNSNHTETLPISPGGSPLATLTLLQQ